MFFAVALIIVFIIVVNNAKQNSIKNEITQEYSSLMDERLEEFLASKKPSYFEFSPNEYDSELGLSNINYEITNIKKAYEKMLVDNLDLVVWGYVADFLDDNENVLNSRKCMVNGICEKGNADILTKKDTLGICGYAWNKLYKTDIIKENN